MVNDSSEIKLDEIDLQILDFLRLNGRATNKAVAEAVQIPQSTCLLKIRRLIDTGVIQGFEAVIDTTKLGRPLQAMLAVRLNQHSRQANDYFTNHVIQLPGVISASLMTGTYDYMIHIATADTQALSEFVLDSITSESVVDSSHTNLILQHMHGVGTWA